MACPGAVPTVVPPRVTTTGAPGMHPDPDKRTTPPGSAEGLSSCSVAPAGPLVVGDVGDGVPTAGGCVVTGVVGETFVRYLKPAKLDDELLVTAEIKETGRASLIIAQQALRPASGDLLCEGTIRIGWVTSATLQPARIPPGILAALDNT